MKKINSNLMKTIVREMVTNDELKGCLTWAQMSERFGITTDRCKELFPSSTWFGGVTTRDLQAYYYADNQFVREFRGEGCNTFLFSNDLDINYLREVKDLLGAQDWFRIAYNCKKIFSNPVYFKEFEKYLGEDVEYFKRNYKLNN